jgi:hypothetical protein
MWQIPLVVVDLAMSQTLELTRTNLHRLGDIRHLIVEAFFRYVANIAVSSCCVMRNQDSILVLTNAHPPSTPRIKIRGCDGGKVLSYLLAGP